MAGGKQTPRQKLIGLMYLIFLALMALNVSVEVLDSFPLIDRGIQETNKNFEMKVDMIYDDFNAQVQNFSKEHVSPYHEQALYIRERADSLVSYIMTNRTLMISMQNNISFEEADTLDLIDLRQKDNYTRSTRFWLEEGGASGGPGTRAYMLRGKIEAFKFDIDSILESHNQSVKLGLDTEGPFYRQDTRIDWQTYNFERVISVAVATNLSRMVTEVRNAQFDAISMLYDLIHAGQFRFDEVSARIVPESRVVMQGGHFEADVFVAAIDTRQDPQVFVDGIGRIPVRDGVGRLRLAASAPGSQTISGRIVVRSPAGVETSHAFRTQYTVESPMATVSPTRMNVFYAGLENPVSIAAGGVPTENLVAEISAGGSLARQRDGSYIVTVDPDVSEVNITVRARVGDRMETMAVTPFRILRTPDPTAYVSGQRGGRIPRQLLTRPQTIIEARMAEDFVFDLQYEVARFQMHTEVAGELRRERQDNGNSLTNQMIALINNARSGQTVTFTDIFTNPGPDGRERNLGALSFTIE